MKKSFFSISYAFIFKTIFILLTSSCNKRIERESIIYYDEATNLNPRIILKQELINCDAENEACYFEKHLLENLDSTILNGVIYPNEEILNNNDINLAPQFQFTFEHLDYSEIEKIEYKYIKYDAIGTKIAETNYKNLTYTNNDYQIPLHVNSLGAGILITEPNEINEVEILIRTYTNYYFKTSFKFYMFSYINTAIEISRDSDLLNTPYYNFENNDIQVLDIINLKNKLNLKLSLNLNIELNNITKASIKKTDTINYNEQVNLQGPSTYEWKISQNTSYQTSSVEPSFLVFVVDELGTIEQILVEIENNTIIINNFIIKENKSVSIIISSNFLKLNILGNSNLGPIYSNLSHCMFLDDLSFCKCRYSANNTCFEFLFTPQEQNTYGTIACLLIYSFDYNDLMENTDIVPACNFTSGNLILNEENIYRTNKTIFSRFHKTSTSVYLSVKIKDYLNFGTIMEKYISFPDIEVQSGELTGPENLYGYIQ